MCINIGNEGSGVIGDVPFPPDGYNSFDGTPFVLDDNGTSGGGNVVRNLLNAPDGTRTDGNLGGSVVNGPVILDGNGVGGRNIIDVKIVALFVGCSAVRGEGTGSDSSDALVNSGDE